MARPTCGGHWPRPCVVPAMSSRAIARRASRRRCASRSRPCWTAQGMSTPRTRARRAVRASSSGRSTGCCTCSGSRSSAMSMRRGPARRRPAPCWRSRPPRPIGGRSRSCSPTSTGPTSTERWSPPEGGHHSAVVHLDPLERDAAAQLLTCLAGERAGALDERVTTDLLDRAGGNPFFLEELVSWLEEPRFADLPDTLRGLVAARIDGLTQSERRVQDDAAVLGSRGRVEWLATMYRKGHGGDDPVASALLGLRAKDLLDVEGDRWEFRSEVVRELTYGTMTKDRRAKVHAGIAAWLELQGQPRDAVVDSIAHHYGRAAALAAEVGGSAAVPANVVARAVGWLRRAGERAAQVDTPQRAVSLFSEGLTLLDAVTADAASVDAGATGDSDQRVALVP